MGLNDQTLASSTQTLASSAQTLASSAQTLASHCEKCKHTFCNVSKLKRHKCRGVDVRTCPDCLHTFNSTQAKYDHKRRGQCKPQTAVQVHDDASTSLRLVAITNNISNNTTINGNNNTINDNRQTNNITINVFGSENMAHILDDIQRMNRYVERCYMAIPYMVRDVHFDPQRPDNHTVRMANCRDKFLEIMTEQGWQSKMKTEVVNDMILRHGDTLEEHFNSDECATLPPWMRQHFEEMLKACTEMPYDKEKRKTMENEVIIVLKDGRRSCGGNGKHPVVGPSLEPPSDAAPLAVEHDRELRDPSEKDEMRRMINKLLKDNEELTRDKQELASELDLMYSQT
jgi:hypothetical protein